MPPLRTRLLSFGLVSIPVQLHTATKDQHIAFHLLHDKSQTNCKAALFLILCLYSLACGKRTAQLKWEDNSDNEKGFRIYRIISKDKTTIAEVYTLALPYAPPLRR